MGEGQRGKIYLPLLMLHRLGLTSPCGLRRATSRVFRKNRTGLFYFKRGVCMLL